MTISDLQRVFGDKEKAACPITEKLIKAGYQQTTNDGYIKKARKLNMVDYKKALPTQWWHLMESYCKMYENNPDFVADQLKCGELLVWMAEVLECVEKEQLDTLVNRIICSAEPQNGNNKPPKYNRDYWQRQIIKLCRKPIINKVEELSKR